MNDSSVAALCHARPEPLPEQIWRLEIDRHRGVPDGVIEVCHRRTHIDAGRIDEDVGLPEHGDRLLRCRPNSAPGAQVAADPGSPAARGCEIFRGRDQGCLGPRDDAHTGSSQGQCARDGSADTRASASDHRYAAVEREHAFEVIPIDHPATLSLGSSAVFVASGVRCQVTDDADPLFPLSSPASVSRFQNPTSATSNHLCPGNRSRTWQKGVTRRLGRSGPEQYRSATENRIGSAGVRQRSRDHADPVRSGLRGDGHIEAV